MRNLHTSPGIRSVAGAVSLLVLLGATAWARAQEAGEAKPAVPAESKEAKPAAAVPAGEAPALGGYCPTTYLLKSAAVKGDPKFQSRYHGELYYLSSAEAKQEFDAEPEKFLPQFDGYCTTALGGSYGNRILADPTVFAIVNRKVYLFSTERAKRAYDEKPTWFIARAMEKLSHPAIKGYCPVTYINRGMAVQGNPGVKATFRARLYYFFGEKQKEAFLENPQAYIPQYDGHCAEGMTRGRRYPADPEQFLIRDGKTYLMYDAKTKIKFLATADEYVKLADEEWAKIKDEPAP